MIIHFYGLDDIKFKKPLYIDHLVSIIILDTDENTVNSIVRFERRHI